MRGGRRWYQRCLQVVQGWYQGQQSPPGCPSATTLQQRARPGVTMGHTLALDLGISGCQMSLCVVTLPSLSPFVILSFTTSSILVFKLSCLALASSGRENPRPLVSLSSICMSFASSSCYALTILQLCQLEPCRPIMTTTPCLTQAAHTEPSHIPYRPTLASSHTINNCQPAPSKTIVCPWISGHVVSFLFPFHLYF